MSYFFFFSSRRRHTRFDCDWSSDVCSSDLNAVHIAGKNVLIFAVCSIVYWAVGFGIAFGDGNAIVGTSGFFPSSNELLAIGTAPYSFFTGIPAASGYLFEVVFAGVSLAIVWGAIDRKSTR